MPALRTRCARNSSGSESESQTCGRNVPRWLPYSSVSPSTPGRSRDRASARSVKGYGSGADSTDTSIWVPGSSSAVSVGKRGSRTAAFTAFAATSSRRDRYAVSDPMQPRSAPCWVSVTNAAPGVSSHGCGFSPPSGSEPAVSVGFSPTERPKPGSVAPTRVAIAERAISHSTGPASRGSSGMSDPQPEGRVADDPVARTGGVARAAGGQELGGPAMPLCGDEGAVERVRTTRTIRRDRTVERDDPLDGVGIEGGGFGVRVVVAQVGGHEQQRAWQPEGDLHDVRHNGRVGGTDRDRYDRDTGRDHLQERQLDLEGVLLGVDIRTYGHGWRLTEGRFEVTVGPDHAERRLEAVGAGQGQPLDVQPMGRSEQQDAGGRLEPECGVGAVSSTL